MEKQLLSILSLILWQDQVTPEECVREMQHRGHRITSDVILRAMARMHRLGWLRSDESNVYSPDWEVEALANILIGQHWIAPDRTRWTTWSWETGHTGRTLLLREVNAEDELYQPIRRRRAQVRDLGGLRLVPRPPATVYDGSSPVA